MLRLIRTAIVVLVLGSIIIALCAGGHLIWQAMALGFLAPHVPERPERDESGSRLDFERFLLRMALWCGLFPILSLAACGLVAIAIRIAQVLTGA
jgi:hypothetical protein